MPRRSVPKTVFAIALSGCVVEPELLNSERIQQRFGSYGIDLFDNDENLRRSNLHSLQNGRKICRTYAVVQYNPIDNDPVGHESIGEEHAQILAGASIGATFKANGWSIYKETRYAGELELPQEATHIRQLLGPLESPVLAMHVYRLLLKKGLQIIDYAIIIELHHPDYLDSDDVARLYLVDAPAKLSASEMQTLSALALRCPDGVRATAHALD